MLPARVLIAAQIEARAGSTQDEKARIFSTSDAGCSSVYADDRVSFHLASSLGACPASDNPEPRRRRGGFLLFDADDLLSSLRHTLARSVGVDDPERLTPTLYLIALTKQDQITRDHMAIAYARYLFGGADYSAVNRAILDRWSMSSLKYIKREAWKRRSD